MSEQSVGKAGWSQQNLGIIPPPTKENVTSLLVSGEWKDDDPNGQKGKTEILHFKNTTRSPSLVTRGPDQDPWLPHSCE
jgi:hypothetical protein